jgi:hypothetical protein
MLRSVVIHLLLLALVGAHSTSSFVHEGEGWAVDLDKKQAEEKLKHLVNIEVSCSEHPCIHGIKLASRDLKVLESDPIKMPRIHAGDALVAIDFRGA